MAGPFKLSPLPYDENALEPVISAKTIGFHYNKHHKTYVETLNKLVEGTRFADMKLEEVVRATAGASGEKEKKIFNNAGQVWNHDFYWRSLSPKAAAPTRASSFTRRPFASRRNSRGPGTISVSPIRIWDASTKRSPPTTGRSRARSIRRKSWRAGTRAASV